MKIIILLITLLFAIVEMAGQVLDGNRPITLGIVIITLCIVALTLTEEK
ncbi:hypothetical protein SAMN05660772_01851 [Pasteurella testudinis DSM 23072]|uniref:Uncharacterized protein n=1 Tax=Pasteurella testudinis DSM 23072 TaxID=1122938 RepID=A0A1W1UK35_9PAST|nr:hypothetical protein [Pasteurella testudinis]SMB81437.1 hypothetical protein SAMN05660772_01851 [Pasteurella testudinis DSM 23072]SUB51409.1 Uncharacterised protein [Pasteurella testudinis]